MLSRHFLRAKVLQIVYATTLQEGIDAPIAEKNLVHHISRLNELGILQLSMLLEFRDAAEQVMDEGTRKFMPTDEERNPNRRILENRFLCRMADNFEFRRQMELCGVDWSMSKDLFRKAFIAVREQPFYQEYLQAPDNYEEDLNAVLYLFKYLINDEVLRDTFFERSLLWEDDFDQIAQYSFMMMKAIDPEQFDEAMPWPLMYDERQEKDVEDMRFARQLLRDAMASRQEGEELIKKHLQHWDFDRVATMDVLLIVMAVAELENNPSIPERVTVDEYIELSKEFSTDKSKLFINGILDKLVIELRAAGRIQKSGRGLYIPGLEEDEEGKQ